MLLAAVHFRASTWLKLEEVISVGCTVEKQDSSAAARGYATPKSQRRSALPRFATLEQDLDHENVSVVSPDLSKNCR
jgi:hypothetical protein